MANPTTNFGWVMPTATDLVTDLPADFAVFGQGVDTSLADLNGGTTGQVLSKTSNTNLDFTWVSDATGMANPMTTTGDTIYSSPGSTPVRRPIGTTGQILTVAGGIPTWATPAGGGKVLQVVQGTTATGVTISTATITDTGLTATITPTLATSSILVLVTQNALLSTIPYAQTSIAYYLYKDSTAIVSGTNGVYSFTNQPSSGNYQQRSYFPLNYLDAPNTTSATTYKTRASAGTNGSTVAFNAFTSTIILLEIGA